MRFPLPVLLFSAVLTGADPAPAETWRLVGSESPAVEWDYADGGFSRSGASAHYVREPNGERFDVQFTWQVPQTLTAGVAAEVPLTADVVAGWPCRPLYLGARVFLAQAPCAFCVDGREVGAGICAEHAQGARTFRIEPGNFGQPEARLHVLVTDGSLFSATAVTYVYSRDTGPPTSTITPTRTPTRTATRTASRTPSATVTRTGTAPGTPTATATRTRTPSGQPTATATRTRTASAPPTASRTRTRAPTAQPPLTPTIVPTRTPTGSQPGDLACGETRQGTLDEDDLPPFAAEHGEEHYFTLGQTTDLVFDMQADGVAPYLALADATYPYAFTLIVQQPPPLTYRLPAGRYAIIAATRESIAGDTHAYTLTMRCDGAATPTATPSRTISPTPSRTITPSPTPTVAPPTPTRGTPTATVTPTQTPAPARTATPTATIAGCIIPLDGRGGTVAGIGSSGCTDLIADAIEITQSIQDLDNSIPLIVGKPTFVRFHVHSTGGPVRATARLRVGTAIDDPLAQDLKPINPAGYITVVEQPDRTVPNAAFLFELPREVLGYEDGDRMVIEAEVDPLDEVAEPTESNNITYATEPVRLVPTMRVAVYHVGYHGLSAPIGSAEGRHARLARDWLAAAFPVSDVEIVERSLPTYAGPPPGCEWINYSLFKTRFLNRLTGSSVPPTALYYGMVYDRGEAANFTRGETNLSVSCGPSGDPRVQDYRWDKDGSYGDWYAGHEIGHALGQEHPGVCPGEDVNSSTGPGPHHPDGLISAFDEGRQAVFGFDVRTRSIYMPGVPGFWHDMMTYCPNQWISDLTYLALFDRLRPAPIAASLVVPAEDHLLVAGTIDNDSGTVAIAPLLTLPHGPDTPPGGGDLAIVLRDGDGAELARHPFTAAAPRDGAALSIFTELVPAAPGTARVEVEGPGVSGSLVAGPSAPEVALTSPNGGEVVNGEVLTVAWTAADADGDTLAFTIQYSADDGGTWEVLASDVDGRSVELATFNLSPSELGRLRVWASDGIQSAHDSSDGPFRVPNRAPEVAIIAPADGTIVARGQTLALIGEVSDRGTPPAAEQIEWYSDRDGVLGTGRRLAIADLSAGAHVVTLRADDGHGGVANDTIRLTIVAELADLPRCAGDCSGDGAVTVDELVAGVGIALGSRAVESCAPLDTDGDGTVTIAELVAAVNAALGAC